MELINYCYLVCDITRIEVAKRWWSISIYLTTSNTQTAASMARWSSDYCANANITLHTRLSYSFSIGAGLGLHTNLVSVSSIPIRTLVDNQYVIRAKNVRIRYYKTLMPTVPLALSYTRKKTPYTLRYEQALFNKIGGDVRKDFSENYGVFYAEIAFRIL